MSSDLRVIGTIGSDGVMRHEPNQITWTSPFAIPDCVAIRVDPGSELPARWLVLDPSRRAPAELVRGLALCELDEGSFVVGNSHRLMIRGDVVEHVASAIPIAAMIP